MTIAVDFDGVIHGYSKGWNGGEIYDEPVPGTKEALEKLRAQKHKIYIVTTRTNKTFGRKETEPDQKKMIEEYMAKHEIPYDKIWTFGKPMADIFIDDRAISFVGDWEDTVKQVENFKVWNRSEE
jgi:ribonucleotide monophosphatase NagD (HAD superfamily)